MRCIGRLHEVAAFFQRETRKYARITIFYRLELTIDWIDSYIHGNYSDMRWVIEVERGIKPKRPSSFGYVWSDFKSHFKSLLTNVKSTSIKKKWPKDGTQFSILTGISCIVSPEPIFNSVFQYFYFNALKLSNDRSWRHR